MMHMHQRRMLVKRGEGFVKITKSTVIDNRPPWLPNRTSPHDVSLRQIQEEGFVNVSSIDYDFMDDPRFLADIFSITERNNQLYTVRSLLENRIAQEEDPHKFLSNFMGMMSAMHSCANADQTIQLCIYFDSDIFVAPPYGGDQSILDSSVELFDKHPELVLLQPPFAHMHELRNDEGPQAKDDDDDKEGCTADFKYPFDGSQFGISSRYMIINRSRLASALPLKATVDMFGGDFPGFENALGNALHAKAAEKGADGFAGFARMVCHSDSFVIHPPVQMDREVLHSVLNSTFLSEYTSNGSALLESKEERTEELIRRIEGGNYSITADSVADHGQAMAALQTRISRGSAW
jgi:hypothetical protein